MLLCHATLRSKFPVVQHVRLQRRVGLSGRSPGCLTCHCATSCGITRNSTQLFDAPSCYVIRIYADNRPFAGHVLLLRHAELRRIQPSCWTCPVAMSCGVTQQNAHLLDVPRCYIKRSYAENRPVVRHAISPRHGDLQGKSPSGSTCPVAMLRGVTQKTAHLLDAPFCYV